MNSLPKTESLTVEFKTSFNEEVIETLVAFSNAKGGTVYVGISNNGELQGITVGKETIQNWINEIKNKTNPKIIPDAEVLVVDDKTIVSLFIIEYPVKPVSTRGKYFKRVSNSNHLLSIDEIANEHLKTINSSWDFYVDPHHSIDDISLDKVQKSMETLRSNGTTINESTLSFLVKYDLLREERLTNAAYLMFKNRDSVETTIELGRFQTPVIIKDTARTKSDILTQVEEVINFVKKHINLEVVITGNPQNTQKWQYPMEAIREIVFNMIIHRDYRSSSDSIVKIFNDKIEFYNPGRLPDTISVEDLLSNSYKSTPRNKKIAEFFKDSGLIEKYGSGIQRIIGYFKGKNHPLPEFKNISDGFQVTVFASGLEKNTDVPEKDTEKGTEKDTGKGTENVTENVAENVAENVTENREGKILELISKDNNVSTIQIAEKLSVTRMTIHRDIEKLKAKGLIERVGADKGGYWKIKNSLKNE
jgi:ATP-dependent DNA helicase RecG